MFNAKSGVSSLMADVRLKVDSLGFFVEVEEGIALGICFVNEFPRDAMVGERKETDVFELSLIHI